MWRYREVLPGPGRQRAGDARRGLHAAAARAAPRRALGLPKLLDQGGGRQPDRLLQGPRPGAGRVDGEGARAPRTSACPRPATPAALSPPTPPAPGCGRTSSCPATSPELFVMETEAYGAEVVLGRRPDHRRRPRLRRARARERLVRVRDAQGALPDRGQEDDGLRDRRAARLDAARRDPLPDRRRHGPHRHVEGLRRAGGDGLRAHRAGRACSPCRPRAARRSSGPSRRAATTRRRGRTRTTLAHGLRVPKALGDFLILRALRESHGAAIAVSEQEI